MPPNRARGFATYKALRSTFLVKFGKIYENVLYAAHTRARFVHGQGARGFITYEVVWRPRSGRSEERSDVPSERSEGATPRKEITPGDGHTH